MDSLQLITRNYSPTESDLKPCGGCGNVCMPFPYRTSPICSSCWFERQEWKEKAETPAKDAR